MPDTTIRGMKMLHARSHTGVSVMLWQRAARAGAALSLAGALAFPAAAGATGTPPPAVPWDVPARSRPGRGDR